MLEDFTAGTFDGRLEGHFAPTDSAGYEKVGKGTRWPRVRCQSADEEAEPEASILKDLQFRFEAGAFLD